jgi:glycosyltransferase involved in cell wall biosynthesis
MKILAVAEHHPMPDRSSGDLRFFELLKCLAREHEVLFCGYKTVRGLSEVNARPYRAALEESGITVRGKSPIDAIKSEPLDAILFEFFFAAESFLDVARFWQPAARVVIDSVDVHFNRLFAKARLTEAEKDYNIARNTKRRELAAYRKADVVIAVSEEDRRILQREVGKLPVEVIPNIHAVPPLVEEKKNIGSSLLFIGNFRHDPNVDAMLYFCTEVLPLIKQEVPDVELTIVGGSPPEEVRRLTAEKVRVLGFVPDVKPLLEVSDISVAPLRYGGGMKGKIGEAMAYGLPVVTTSIGTEGFGLTSGQHVLVGDTPEAFASAVVDLIRDRELYERLRRTAWTFVNDCYSVSAVSKSIHELICHLNNYPIKKLSRAKWLGIAARYQLDRHVLWRLKRPKR